MIVLDVTAGVRPLASGRIVTMFVLMPALAKELPKVTVTVTVPEKSNEQKLTGLTG